MLADDIAKAVGLKAGAATAVLGAGPGWVMGRMMGGETGKTLVRSILKGMGAEGAEEFLQSGAEGYIGAEQTTFSDGDPVVVNQDEAGIDVGAAPDGDGGTYGQRDGLVDPDVFADA